MEKCSLPSSVTWHPFSGDGGGHGWMLTTQPLPDIYVASGGREEPFAA